MPVSREATLLIIVLKFIHLSSLVVWVGSIVFFSFFAAPSIFKVLPQGTAGDVVGDIFPKYRAVGYLMSVTALATLLGWSYLENEAAWARVAVLAVMTVVTFYSGLVVGARAQSIKAKMRGAEDGEEKEGFGASFRRVHALSSILNMAVLVLGVVVIFLTARGLRL